jgi:hypothetical protein
MTGDRSDSTMLKWIIRVLLMRTVLRRFWLFAIIYAVARRFLPWENEAGERSTRRNFA